MKKVSLILLTSLFAFVFFSTSASAQDKSDDKKIQKTENDSDEIEWVEEVARRAYLLSEEAARKAEVFSREMERRAYHQMEEFGRHGHERMEKRDSSRMYRRYDFPNNLDSLEIPGLENPADERMLVFPDMPDLPPVPDIPDMSGWRNYGYGNPSFHGYSYSDSKSGSSWNYSRRLNDATYSTEYTVGTDAATEKVDLAVFGDCDKGSIIITVTSPDGKKMSDIVIDENGNMNWRKSFTTTDNKWAKGNWTFKVTTKSATGHFNISLDSF
jgi:hypothetical protein